MYGRVLAAEVSAVEAIFDTGLRVRAVPAAEGFALLGSGAERLVELRVLDDAGTCTGAGRSAPASGQAGVERLAVGWLKVRRPMYGSRSQAVSLSVPRVRLSERG